MRALVLAGWLALVPLAAQACEAGAQSFVRSTLFFGMSKPKGGLISERQWRAFLRDEITPRFRDGLTVLDGRGQWLGAGDRLYREPAKVVTLLHADAAPPRQAIRELIAAYNREFDQEAVLWETTPVCATFLNGR